MSNVIPQTTQRPKRPIAPPTQPPLTGNVPSPDDIVSFKIKLPRQYFDLFSEFAAFLHKQPVQNPQTGEYVVDPKTNQYVMSLPAGDIATYFMTCAFNTYQSYQMLVKMAQQKQATRQQPPQPQVPSGSR